ncbi:alpha/beta fold hydrolase [Variovorax sp. Sphag1AA]|uniref:alpha/beta fold hydrolase n=1 Tax=Variovorax sp. Sphag1AA TaxID=2587027 RepID=UPI00160CD592|nr:alpha/beta hydrolase [Variovorax sp. Sphag1AA]MBB3179494.1 pimeloyl-ACP methyl ester carboxylesterase [Variovorax sp. Sphag1AA]
MKVSANGIQIEVEDSGGEGRPAILLIMGLGMQLIGWPAEFVETLVDAGFRVIRHDNRDIGLSQGFDEAGTGNVIWQSVRQRFGLQVRSAYSLQDMADDALGVLDALGVERAHVIGASMGGMIAQRLAASAPRRMASLVSIMSSSGARNLPGPRADVAAALLRRPASRTEAALVEHGLRFYRLISSPAYARDERIQADRIARALRRAYRPAGVTRQILAIAADGERAELLSRIESPSLVLHGEADPLVPIACGEDTARRIRGARFVGIPGMGHDLPPPVIEILLQHIVPFLQTAQSRS